MNHRELWMGAAGFIVLALVVGAFPPKSSESAGAKTPPGQALIDDLHDALDAGHVRIVSARGNGNSSGASIEGYLLNEAHSERHVSIHLKRPLYFVNSGVGQNMVALQVYLGDGGYRSDGRRSFVTLPEGVQTRVLFIAFCADFEKANPSPNDSFALQGTLPPPLEGVLARIRAHSESNPDEDSTVAAQVAIWMAQGIERSEILSRFPFTPADELLAASFTR